MERHHFETELRELRECVARMGTLVCGRVEACLRALAGRDFDAALREAAAIRLRPILMTAITTAAGAVPLVLSTGAGTETRAVIGTVVMTGILVATLLTLFVVPAAYQLLARRTGSPGAVRRRIEAEMAAGADSTPKRVGSAGS